MKLKILKAILLLIIPCLIFGQSLESKLLERAEHLGSKTSIEQELEKQQDYTNTIIKNINGESYLYSDFKVDDYENRSNYLLSKISINEREHNDVAVQRDKIKFQILKQEKLFDDTLIELVSAKESYKDKNYFINVIKRNINLIEENKSNDSFEDIYQKELRNDNKISNELVQNYLTLNKQTNQQLYTLRYLLDNMQLYRKTNFFIDEFNLQHLISKIDTFPLISSLSQFTSYYLKFSIGQLVVILLIILFFRIFITRFVSYLPSYLSKFFFKTAKEENKEYYEEIASYIEKSTKKPLTFALYILSIQISIYILVKDNNFINKINPWINTVYMSLLTLAVYFLLSKSISNFAQQLTNKYPNVRKEMIVFILRILKIILVLLVLLFLFTQLNIDIKAIAASLGVGGIAIALASKDTLANFFGSLNIMTDNSFSQGDWIVADNIEGTVVDIRIRTTRIRTFDNAMITIPNSILANTHIKNYSKRRIGRRIKMKLGITYQSDMQDIVNLRNDIFKMLENHPDISTKKDGIYEDGNRKFEAIKKEDLQGVKRTLLVYIDEYNSSSIDILIYCFARSPQWESWLMVKEDILVKISELVKKNNCDFAYPTQTLFLKN